MKHYVPLLICLTTLFCIKTHATEKEAAQPTTLSVLLKKVKLSGYAQTGYTYNSSESADGKASSTFDIKRIMFITEAEVIKNTTLYFMYDFNASRLHEIWGEYKFDDALKLKVGQFKVPLTLEGNMSPSVLEIISGSQSVNYLTGIPATDVCYGGNGGRDQGVMIHGDLLPLRSHKFVSYKVGVFNGQGIGMKDRNNNKAFAAWLLLSPVKELKVGGSIYLAKGNAREDNPFQDFMKDDNYRRNRWALTAEMTTAPLYLRAEYLQGKDGNIDSEGYYVVASAPICKKVDIVASYDYFSPFKDAKEGTIYSVVPKQTNYTLGAQWYFHRRCRLQLQYVFQEKAKGWKNANVLMTQFQIGF